MVYYAGTWTRGGVMVTVILCVTEEHGAYYSVALAHPERSFFH